jgi:hypothetical protein
MPYKSSTENCRQPADTPRCLRLQMVKVERKKCFLHAIYIQTKTTESPFLRRVSMFVLQYV